jgi:hypothetical protein
MVHVMSSASWFVLHFLAMLFIYPFLLPVGVSFYTSMGSFTDGAYDTSTGTTGGSHKPRAHDGMQLSPATEWTSADDILFASLAV